MSEQLTPDKYFAPAFFVEPLEEGDTFPTGGWPEHITLHRPVKGHFLKSGLAEKFDYHFEPHIPFEVTVGKKATMWAFSHPDPALLIDNNSALQRVHTQLQSVLADLPSKGGQEFTFTPHITITSPMFTRTGDTLLVDGFSVVEKSPEDASWTVVKNVPFARLNNEERP